MKIYPQGIIGPFIQIANVIANVKSNHVSGGENNGTCVDNDWTFVWCGGVMTR